MASICDFWHWSERTKTGRSGYTRGKGIPAQVFLGFGLVVLHFVTNSIPTGQTAGWAQGFRSRFFFGLKGLDIGLDTNVGIFIIILLHIPLPSTLGMRGTTGLEFDPLERGGKGWLVGHMDRLQDFQKRL